MKKARAIRDEIMEEKMSKIVSYDGENFSVVKTTASYLWMGSTCIDFFNNIEIGKCSCCGEKNYISFQGNVIYFHCIINDENKGFACKVADRCPGKDQCPNIDDFDQEREERVVAMLRDLIDKTLDAYGSVLIDVCSDTRKTISRYYLPDEKYVLRTQIINVKRGDDRRKDENWFCLRTDGDISMNRTSIAHADEEEVNNDEGQPDNPS
jgi:methylphosphotriester-DNA--protein-cysteine methyltransferase